MIVLLVNGTRQGDQCGKNAFPTPDIFYQLFLPTPIANIGIFNIRFPRQRELAHPNHILEVCLPIYGS